MTSLLHPPQFRLEQRSGNHLHLRGDTAAVIDVFVLEHDIIRVRVLPNGVARGPRSWAIAPGQEDVAIDGRDRLDLSGFALPAFTLREETDTLHVQTEDVRLDIKLNGGRCSWSLRRDGVWHIVLEDR